MRKERYKGTPGLSWTYRVGRSALSRFLDHVALDSTTGCILWSGGLSRDGYGHFGTVSAHRFAYETFIGPVPPGLVLDHNCVTPNCVNPKHLNPCTQRENLFALHSKSVAKKNAMKTHCPLGHE